MTAQPADHLPVRLGAGVAGAFLLGEVCPFALPLMVTGIATKFSVEPGAVGLFITAQLLAATLAAFAIAPRIDRLDRRRLAMLAVVLIIAGNILSAFSSSLPVFVASRVLAGVGEGLVHAAGIAACASSRHAGRLYSISWFTIVLLSLAIYSVFPPLIVEYGFQVIFLWMSALLIPLALTLICLPRHAQDAEGGIEARRATPPRFSLVHIAIMLSFLLFYIGVNATWYFMERIGEHHGLSLPTVGHGILIASIVALSGPVIGFLISDRLGYRIPLLVALVLLAIATNIITALPGFWPFTVGFSLASTCYVFGVPFFYALAAAVDPTGRLPAALRGAGGLGNAIAPTVAGAALLATGQIWSIGVASAVVCAATFLILVTFVFRQDPQRTAGPSAGATINT